MQCAIWWILIGNAIGSVLRVDSDTASEAKGRFARICIHVNLDKPLTTSILLEGVVQEVLYEGINTLCFSCGRVGHQREGCPFTVNEKTPSLEVKGPVSSTNKADISGEAGGYSQEAGKVDFDLKGDRKDTYGLWLLVKRKNKAEGLRNINQGVGVGPRKGYFRNVESPTRQVHIAREKLPYNARYGPDKEIKKPSHKVPLSPSSVRERKKQPPFYTQ